MGGWWRWALVSPDGVAPSQMVSVSAAVNRTLHHKVQKFSSGTGSTGGPGKRAVKQLWCGGTSNSLPYATGPLSCLSVLSVILVYCGQTVGQIKTSLGTEVDLDPGDTVLDGDPVSPTEMSTVVPIFCQCLLWPNSRPPPQLLSSCCYCQQQSNRVDG